MADIVSPEDRSRMMASIKGKNTKPEIIIRKALFNKGYRYRLHGNKLPGKPDLVLNKYKAVIFINGCFWHQHDCHLFKWPSTRKEFWKEKITGNKARDIKNREKLRDMGWRIMTIWECSIKGKQRLPLEDIVESCSKWLDSDKPEGEIRGEQRQG